MNPDKDNKTTILDTDNGATQNTTPADTGKTGASDKTDDTKTTKPVDEKTWFMSQIKRASGTLQSMEMRLNLIIEDRSLNVPCNQMFANYNPFQLETVAVDIVGLFQRHSILLATYESICEWGLKVHGDKLSQEQRSKVDKLMSDIKKSRHFYIDQYGRAIVRGFHERLLIESRTNAKINDLESLLIRYLGSAYPSADNDSGLMRLQNLLYNVGQHVYRPQEAQTLIELVEKLPLNNAPAVPPADKDRTALEDVFTAIDVKLNHLQKTLERIIRERELTRPENELVRKYKYVHIENIVVQVQYHFSRASLLLSCFEAELKFSALQHNLTKQPGATKTRYAELMHRITKMRKHYVDEIGATLLRALIRHLRIKGSFNAKDIDSVDSILIMYFGIGMPAPGDYDCPSFHELVGLLKAVGIMTGRNQEADILINCMKTTARLENKPPVR